MNEQRKIRLDKIGLTVGITLSVLWCVLVLFSIYYGVRYDLAPLILFGTMLFAPSAFIVPMIMFPFLRLGCRRLHKDFHQQRGRMGDGVVFLGDGSARLEEPRSFENTYCVKCDKWVDFIG